MPVVIRPAAPAATAHRVPLPRGRSRAWYITHNRRRKAWTLAIALHDRGIYIASAASNARIRAIAEQTGTREPSTVTCDLVRTFMRTPATTTA